MANFLSTAFGGNQTAKFEMGGISQLFLLPYNKIIGNYTAVNSTVNGSVIAISDINLTTDKFMEIAFVEGSASYTDAFTPSGSKKFMELQLNFTVDESGDTAIDKAHSILLQRKLVALVQRKNGKWYLLGQSDGLAPDASTANSGAARGDESSMTFSLKGGNLGYAAEVKMAQADIEAIVTRVV